MFTAVSRKPLEASGAEINLYIDIHQTGRQRNSQIATLGISRAEAEFIKTVTAKFEITSST
jgi:hypothetical protein